MFVVVFLFGLLFVFINIIIEICLDVIKFLCYFCWLDVVCVEDIGVWYDVLEVVIRVLVLVNVFIFVFILEFILKFFYKVMYVFDCYFLGGGILKGYVNFILVVIDLDIFYLWENGI